MNPMQKRVDTIWKFITYGLLIMVICGVALTILDDSKAQTITPTQNSYIPCQNLDALDSIDEIIHWEIWDDTLHIYTKQDSARDEQERIRYIMYLEDDWDWEEEFENELKNEN